MKTIVILGGGGFIGSRLGPALAALGYRVHSVSRRLAANPDPAVDYIQSLYDDFERLGELYSRADYVFHLAWDTTPATSAKQPALELTTNLMHTLRLLEYLEHSSSAALIFVSSGGTVYGDGSERQEQTALSPISYYGAGKASIELFLRAYAHQSGHGVVILRPANVYGPGQLPKQQFGIVPTLLQAIDKDRVFTLMGDGNSRREFVFVDDFVRLCLLLVDAPATGCECFNVGSGEAVSINELLQLAEQVAGRQARVERVPARVVDVRAAVLNSSRVRDAFGWQVETGLEKGLEATWAWLKGR